METDPSSGQGATPVPGSPVTGTPAPAGATPQKPSTTTLEEALARIAELEHSHKNKTEEAARHAKKLSAYEAQEKAAQDAALSEMEKANKRAVDAESRIQQMQQQLVVAQVNMAAQARGIIDPELATLALQKSLEYGDDGMPSNLDKALDELIKAKPFLLKPAESARATPTSGGATNPSRSTAASGELSWNILTRLTPQEYTARQDEIQRWMERNPPKRF